MLLSYLILFIMMLSVELLQLLLVRIPAFFGLNHYLLSPPRPDLDLNDRLSTNCSPSGDTADG